MFLEIGDMSGICVSCELWIFIVLPLRFTSLRICSPIRWTFLVFSEGGSAFCWKGSVNQGAAFCRNSLPPTLSKPLYPSQYTMKKLFSLILPVPRVANFKFPQTALPEKILHHCPVWRTWLFIAYPDESWYLRYNAHFSYYCDCPIIVDEPEPWAIVIHFVQICTLAFQRKTESLVSKSKERDASEGPRRWGRSLRAAEKQTSARRTRPPRQSQHILRIDKPDTLVLSSSNG